MVTTIKELFLAAGRVDRAFEDLSEGSRTPAMTVELGMERYLVTRPRPIPNERCEFMFEMSWERNLVLTSVSSSDEINRVSCHFVGFCRRVVKVLCS